MPDAPGRMVIFRPGTIALIALPLTKNSRRIRATVPTTSIPIGSRQNREREPSKFRGSILHADQPRTRSTLHADSHPVLRMTLLVCHQLGLDWAISTSFLTKILIMRGDLWMREFLSSSTPIRRHSKPSRRPVVLAWPKFLALICYMGLHGCLVCRRLHERTSE